MTNVVPFAPRPSAGGGWTAAEQARLSELAERLAAGGVKVEVVYGVTDEGDPWCVIKDDQEEVLIHVARIDGLFVIHDASLDTIQQGETLWAACDRMLGGDWRDSREDVVVSLSGRQAQTFIALVVAAGFIQQADDAEAASVTSQAENHIEMSPPVMVSAAAGQASGEELQRQDLLAPQHEQASDEQRQAAAPLAQIDEPPAPEPTSASEAEVEAEEPEAPLPDSDVSTPVLEAEAASAPLAAGQGVTLKGDNGDNLLIGGAGHDTIEGGAGDDTLHGGAGDDSLSGGPGADLLFGGEGADTLDGGGAPEGLFDFLDGGAGDDQLNMHASTIAKGGEGADLFVFAGSPGRDGLMGVVTDFSEDDGDRLAFAGKNATVVSQQAVANIFEIRQDGTAPPMSVERVQPGLRIGVDLNGDGNEDGFFLLSRPSGGQNALDAKASITAYGLSAETVEEMWSVLKQRSHDDGDFLA
jgi:hypothetical protein